MSHADLLRRLAGKFQPEHRYANFGPLLQSMEIRGFRGVQELTLQIASPVTALSGMNGTGTGKSTIAQLATCGYRKASTAANRRYYVKEFFPVSAADPEPFAGNAQVVYSYCVERGGEAQRVTVSRTTSEWSGYKRQPERSCHYIGFTQFIPKVERRDMSIYSGHRIELAEPEDLDDSTAGFIGQILGLPYERLSFAEASHRGRVTQLAMATRSGRRYSENHMGFGEGRVVYMVRAMEAAPVQSLFVLEEPETSLHGLAQKQLARYLVDVSFRRGHQILLTTHSVSILEELSRDSVMYLRRAPEGALTITPGLSSYQIESFIQSGAGGVGHIICVEDAFARYFGIELLRRCDPNLLAGCKLVPVGGHTEIPRALEILQQAGVRAAGLSDGDRQDRGPETFSLPGEAAPEAVVFRDAAVRQHYATAYGLDLAETLAPITDPHEFPNAVATQLMLEETFVATEACRAYVAARDPQEFEGFTAFLHRQPNSDRN